MTNEELQKIIERFDENDLIQKGIFGIFQFGGGSDESFVRANKEGLVLFALELLKSARGTEAMLNDTEKKIIPFDIDENWIDENSDTFIHYIEPIADKKIAKQKEVNKAAIAGKLMPYIFILIMILLVISGSVGIITIIKWLF